VTAEELDEVYTRLCREIDAVRPGESEAYLARLVLLLMGEVDNCVQINRVLDAAHGFPTLDTRENRSNLLSRGD
jgi:hypothetical protein